MMNRQEAVQEACAVFALVFRSIGDYSHAADCFCDRGNAAQFPQWTYQNEGRVFDWVRQAILEKLSRDGHTVAAGFDPVTGKEKVTP